MFILSAALMWAVWEGNAAAGSREEFPSGLFAFSDLFPQHTLIEIVNLEQNTKSRAVILGNTGSGGLLVKVSPDLAAALGIKAGNTVRVRISVPPVVAEEGADPMLLGKVEDKRTAPVVKSSPKEPQEAASVKELSKTAAMVAASAPLKTEERVYTPRPQEVPEPVRPPKPHAPTVRAPAEVREPVRPQAAATGKPHAVKDVAEPVQPVTEPAAAPAAVAEADEPMQPPAKTANDEAIEPVAAAAPIQEPPAARNEEDGRQVPEVTAPKKQAVSDMKSERPVPEVASPAMPESAYYAERPVAEAAPIEEPLYDTDETIPEHLDIDEAEQETEEPVLADKPEPPLGEQHVMLVPAEPREPVGEVPPPAPKKSEVLAVAPIVKEEQPLSRPAEEPYTTDALKKGSFYVQIGHFKDSLNVESFIQRYGKQYPVTVEKSSTVKDSMYKVYIGPLQKDERGATLETFQKLGFKDAFLKRAP